MKTKLAINTIAKFISGFIVIALLLFLAGGHVELSRRVEAYHPAVRTYAAVGYCISSQGSGAVGKAAEQQGEGGGSEGCGAVICPHICHWLCAVGTGFSISLVPTASVADLCGLRAVSSGLWPL